MKVTIVILVVLLATSVAFAQGTVGSVSGPSDQPQIAVAQQQQETPASSAAPAPKYVPAGADQLPLGQSRDDMEKASAMTLSGQHGDINATKVSADYGNFKVLYVNGRRIVLDRNGKVFGSKSVAKAKKVVPFQRRWNNAAKKAGVVGRSFVEARDEQNLAASYSYTDQKVGQLWIAVAIIGLIVLVALLLGIRCVPRWRRVHY